MTAPREPGNRLRIKEPGADFRHAGRERRDARIRVRVIVAGLLRHLHSSEVNALARMTSLRDAIRRKSR